MSSSNIQRVFSGAPWESRVGYCRAIRIGPMIVVTGTTAVDDLGQPYAVGMAYEQSKKCLEIIEKALVKLGANRHNIIRTRMFVTDISKWAEFGRAHGEFFVGNPPAATMVEVKSLIDKDLMIEIEADAYVHDDRFKNQPSRL